MLAALTLAHAAKWNEGCLCELKDTPAASQSDLAMPAIFGTRFFRQGGRVAQFCPCSIETVQRLNSEVIAPRLLPLLKRTYFRYVKFSLDKECPFWDDSDGTCALRECALQSCSEDEERRLAQCGEDVEDVEEGALGHVQRTSLAALGEAAPSWDLALPWTVDDDASEVEGAEWVDLVDNPEQYTGYSAAAGASRIWHELHAHNVFHTPGCCDLEESPDALSRLPVEQRLFYRLASGLHASISSHIAAHYLLDRRSATWGLELDEYERRLGAHPDRLENVHFTYLTVLRAVELASSHLSEHHAFSTGVRREDAAVGREVRELLSTHPEWPLTHAYTHAHAHTCTCTHMHTCTGEGAALDASGVAAHV